VDKIEPLQHNIKFLREYLKMTQEKLGNDVGASEDQIGTYEKRGTRPKSPIINRLVKVFGIPRRILETVELDEELYNKHFDETLVEIEPEPSRVSDGEEREYKTKNKPTDQEVTMQVLADAAATNKNNSEAVRSIARSNEELVAMLKAKMFSSDFEKNTLEATVATIAGLREYMIDLTAVVKKQPRKDAEQEFYKKVGEQMDKT